MPVLMDPASELTALLVVLAFAAPAVVLLCLTLEECPLKTKDTLEDTPCLCGVTASDCAGQSNASLVCLFAVVGVILLSTAASGMWLMVWRGAVMADPGGSSVTSAISSFALLVRAHSLAKTPAPPRAPAPSQILRPGVARKGQARGLAPFGAALQLSAARRPARPSSA
mmetsp:Transcript_4333/g.12719  ORF Transcript_4333/g.12719 Transcript_4333/m.12719 type:complete len:169 (-) Transcript_4333:125-631(-)